MKEGIFFNNIDEFLLKYQNSNSTFLLFIAEKTSFNPEDFKNTKADINGAILPEIIYNNKHFKKGLIACELSIQNDLFLVDLNSFKAYKTPFKDVNSLIVLLDGLSSNISSFLDNLKESIDEDTKVIGAGAGKSHLKQEPVIFTNDRIYDDVALIITTKMKEPIILDNGLDYIDGPFLTTSSQKNILKTLNFKNAMDIYKQTIEDDSGVKLTKENFSKIAKYYPLGIEKTNDEMIIRNAIDINKNQDLILIGEVLQNSTINILKCSKESLSKSSSQSLYKKLKNTKKKLLIFNCLARMQLLEEKFDEELKTIQDKLTFSQNLFGALSLGEIVNTKKNLIFNNNSCILSSID